MTDIISVQKWLKSPGKFQAYHAKRARLPCVKWQQSDWSRSQILILTIWEMVREAQRLLHRWDKAESQQLKYQEGDNILLRAYIRTDFNQLTRLEREMVEFSLAERIWDRVSNQVNPTAMIADAPAHVWADNASLIQYPRIVQLVHVRLSNGVTSVSRLLHVSWSANVTVCFSRTHPLRFVLAYIFAFDTEHVVCKILMVRRFYHFKIMTMRIRDSLDQRGWIQTSIYKKLFRNPQT